MSGITSYAYEGFGSFAKENFGYSQVVRVGDRVVASGQGGWDHTKSNVAESLADGTAFPKDIAAEIDQAFANVEHALQDAGAKGWSQVYKVLTLSTSIPEQHEHIVRNMKKWMPDHRATWTELGISHLGGGPAMRFEIEVEAHDPEGAKKSTG